MFLNGRLEIYISILWCPPLRFLLAILEFDWLEVAVISNKTWVPEVNQIQSFQWKMSELLFNFW